MNGTGETVSGYTCPHRPRQVDLGRRQEVVVYDQSTKDAGQLPKDSFVHILLSKLDGTFHRVSLLTGTDIRQLCRPEL
ncbi:Dual specificity protein phosphatase 8 [Labeo rohita]|uniref:Dual specificity protein phosphatase 8 n=1 Tax=Labeo rohita TaxID=84645 RepID=A0ABQ8LD77_LABRO|nr:Dual specificity protein phosphatase 8 [Labeo rohita]